jgi:hypothetical protein
MNAAFLLVGMELAGNANFKSDESIRMGLTSFSVSQIGRFVQSKQRTGQTANPATP